VAWIIPPSLTTLFLVEEVLLHQCYLNDATTKVPVQGGLGLILCVTKITRRYAQRAQTSARPEDPDFGLWTPGSEA